jgi:hypothetical protein
MSTRNRTRPWFELDPTIEQPAGEYRPVDGHDRPFHGWLELVALIDQARAGTSHAPRTTLTAPPQARGAYLTPRDSPETDRKP